jgi:hypothetical protein
MSEIIKVTEDGVLTEDGFSIVLYNSAAKARPACLSIPVNVPLLV